MATIEIDGKTYQVDNGKMIIEVADDNGIHIPRFCYHKKLSVAANCRMCLVQVENSRKPVPACATPITDGMKIYTKSEEAIRSQKAVMEFLLINHPLDCPICDQGGECELQDVSIGFGSGESEYKEAKRAVSDDNLGSLISTEMTRCIHCTRCVRFGDEVAGVRELGATGRGEQVQIGTYIQHAMTSEVSGNVIDLCPVGALTSKPFRFTARAWEMTQHSSIAPHDCIGSNIYVHVRRGEAMRVVPRECETINETWISDRDRYSYLGSNHPDRAKFPRIKKAGQWETVDWPTALQFAVDGMSKCIQQHGVEQFAGLASASSTLEELYLFQRWMRALGVMNLDHRLQQTDFRDQDYLSMMPQSSLPFAELEKQNTVLLVGTHLHREVPMAGIRVRKAWVSGAQVFAINPVAYDFPFTVAEQAVSSPHGMLQTLASILFSLVDDVTTLPIDLQKWLLGVKKTSFSKQMALALKEEKSVIVTGLISENHPDAAILRTLVHYISELSGASVLRLTQGANSAGASLAGVLPHRSAMGEPVAQQGQDVKTILENKLKGYCLMGVEPGYDFSNPHLARQALLAAEFVVVLSAFDEHAVEEYANVILPMASFIETAGTYINVDQTWQTVTGCALPPGEARPAWKIIRVLGNLMDCSDFEYTSTEQVLQEIQNRVNQKESMEYRPFDKADFPVHEQGLVRIGEWPLYRVDSLVRHADALQQSGSADKVCVRMHPETADIYKLGENVTLSQGEIAITLPLLRDDKVAKESVWVLNAMPETIDLGYAFAKIEVRM
jgi:NADH-quinone oxidoreductase subunit G